MAFIRLNRWKNGPAPCISRGIQIPAPAGVRQAGRIAAMLPAILLFASCSSGPLIIPKYSSAGNPPFVIGLLALGILLGLLWYNLFLAISTREAMFFYFSAMMLLLSILQTFSSYDRFFFQLTYNRVTFLTHSLFIIFLIFFEDFYQIGDHAPRLSFLNRISIAVIAGYTAAFFALKLVFPQAAGLHGTINFIRELFVFYTNMLFIANNVIALRWMRKEALIILIAFIPPALLTSLNAMNIFPFMARFQRFTLVMMQYNQPIGLSLQAVLLSLALANRYNRIKAERMQAERERAELKKIDAEKTEFFMNVSHELRTPLTIILGLARQLREGAFGSPDSDSLAVLELVERNGLLLQRQVEALLRLGNPKEKSGQVDMELLPQVKVCYEAFKPIAEARGLVLDCLTAPDAENASLRIRPDDFDSLIMNLLSNAVKYSSGGDRITIRVSLLSREQHSGARISAGAQPSSDKPRAAAGMFQPEQPEAAGLRIAVEDTGPGIPSNLRKRIFQRYARFTDGNVSGSGLGLALVREIIEAYGGSVKLAENHPKGSIFQLDFPPDLVRRAVPSDKVEADGASRAKLADGRSTHEEQAPSSRQGPDSVQKLHPAHPDRIDMFTAEFREAPAVPAVRVSESESGSDHPAGKILIVEDNRDMCGYITSILAPVYRTVCVHGGNEALELLGRESFHLILSDVMMPDLDGHGLLREYRSRFSGSTVPFIFLTARDSLEEKIESMQDGAMHYLTKPFKPRELLTVVDSVLMREQVVVRDTVSRIQKKIDAVLQEVGSQLLSEGTQAPDRVDPVSPEELARTFGLSHRETEILVLLTKGSSDKEIAVALNVSPSTVANHNRSIYGKLGVSGRIELISKWAGFSTS